MQRPSPHPNRFISSFTIVGRYRITAPGLPAVCWRMIAFKARPFGVSGFSSSFSRSEFAFGSKHDVCAHQTIIGAGPYSLRL